MISEALNYIPLFFKEIQKIALFEKISKKMGINEKDGNRSGVRIPKWPGCQHPSNQAVAPRAISDINDPTDLHQ
ncbi:hypothetical protein [Rhodoferax aquaticus]|uniref:Uncharacterized protein n=1 Tax=Rhodoferax aquaticus TaxID=2527691 RepID=A0A515ER44_9BURK|nr:hypothetical protein [Rhodoferax aquaticus]QDL55141.1 hypothetical protein EXZ61_13750 [Rhodoferax aquaticus]